MLALLLLMLVYSVFSQTLDISLNTSASASKVSEDLSASASQGATLALTVPTGSKTRLVLRGGATVSLSYAAGEATVSYPSELGQINLQEASWNFGAPLPEEDLNMLSIALGRIPYTDPTASLFVHRLDGMSIQASYPRFTMQAVLGYTGFLPADGTIIPSTSDTNYGLDGLLTGFAPPRALMAFTIRPQRIAGHDFYASFLAQEDLRDESLLAREYDIINPVSEGGTAAAEKSGPADKAYLTAGFSGPSSAPFVYSGYMAVQVGRVLSKLEDPVSENQFYYLFAPVKAFSFGGQLRFALNPRINLALRLQYGSGDPDAPSGLEGNGAGDSTQFVPITRTSPGSLVFTPTAGNTSFISASLSGRPFPNVAIGPKAISLTSRTFLFTKNGEGPISEAGVDSSAGFSLLGIEQDFSASVKLLSDLNANLSIGTFLPFSTNLGGAFDPSYVETAPVQLMIRAGLALAL
jgi:hypothetical protein